MISTMESIEELDPDGQWWVHERPFRHIRAQNVLRKEAYAQLEAAFAKIRDGTTATDKPQLQTRQGYDALMVAMTKQLAAEFAPLFDHRWIALLARLLDLPLLPQVDGGLHHIPMGSRSGWVHNDYCSAWFDAGTEGDVVLPDRTKCDYFTGRPKADAARPREFIRAGTMIFYLDNGDWRPGAGGETGLYPTARAGIGTVTGIPPVSNSLLLFRCSPHSYHRLIANPGCARNSIILWLHETVQHATGVWGNAVTRRKVT